MAEPTRDFKLDADGEWVTENGDFVRVGGADAVPQGIRIRVGLILGEAYLDESEGVDYFGSVLVKNPDPIVVRSVIGEQIAKTPDVVAVVGAQLTDEGDRQASIAYQVDTVYGQAFTDSVQVPG